MTDTATRTLTITVPMAPPRALLPNNRLRRGGLYPGIDAAAETREVAKYAAMEHVNGKPIIGPVHLTIHAAYGVDPASGRARNLPDLDGTISSAKNMIDGLVEAGLIYDDDQVKLLTASHERLPITRKHRPTGYTVFTITELEP